MFPLKQESLEIEFNEYDVGKAFGVGMKAIRKHKKITLVQMYNDIEIPNPTLSRYENGLIIPTITQSMRIASYFNMSTELIVLLGAAGIYENANMPLLYDNLQKAFATNKKEATLKKARKHR